MNIQVYQEKLNRIEAICKELDLPAPLSATLGLEVKDRHGHFTHREVMPVQSWTRNGLNVFSSVVMGGVTTDGGSSFGAGSLCTKGTDGAIDARGYVPSQHTQQQYTPGSWNQNAGDTSRGIVVGTGSTAESLEDYVLANLITHGTGSGQLSYGASTTTPTWDSVNRQFTCNFVRILTNLSGATITVNEYGAYPYIYYGGVLLLVRDVLATGLDVTNESTLTVTYTVKSPVYPS